MICNDYEIIKQYLNKQFPFTKLPPHPAQMKTLADISEHYFDKSVFSISCGNSFGKTALMVLIILNMVYPKEFRTFHLPLFDDYEQARNKGEDLNIWIVGSASNLRPGGAIYNTFKKFAGDQFEYSQNRQEYIINNQVFKIKTHDQNIDAYKGPRCFAIFVDEPPKEQIYYEMALRLTGTDADGQDLANKMFMTFTPVDNKCTYLADFMENPQWLWCKGSVYDNPFSSKQTIKMIEDLVAINPDERESRLFGEFRKFAGRVFKTFDETLHVIDQLPQDKYKYYVSIDPHDKKSAFYTLAAVNNCSHNTKIYNQVVILDCFPETPWNQIKTDNLTIKQQLEKVDEMLARHGISRQQVTFTGDKIYFNQKRTQLDGKETIADKYYKAGVTVNTSGVEMGWDNAIETINSYLYGEQVAAGVFPTFFVHRQADNIIRAFKQFSYSGRTGFDETWECPIATLKFLLSLKPKGPDIGFNADSTGWIAERKKQDRRAESTSYSLF